jgi:hypothetical protein
MTSTMSATVQFFYDHAGYSWNKLAGQTEEQGHLETAQDLAMAEQTATERGWVVQWSPDGDAENPGEMVAILDDGEGETLAALGGIDAEPGDYYSRVIEAQLALGAIMP